MSKASAYIIPSTKVSPKKTVRKAPTKSISKTQKTPLEVMIFIMNKSLEEENYDLALNVAYKVAPYLHAKLTESKLEVTNLKRPEEMSDEELQIFIGASKAGSPS
ncbi:unnamed protein product [Commensalibacter communis]|uniref:Uncharacterized protein n=1 Tax=Commensalibacter communis TaxID=2972786 RepID=A0A9W4TRL2_9PROT|nr:hypothetical protein [Commensalibacter communis]CAI3956099.1 unnamed protein product [Commensalibacter communis]CAI3958610.1 unnamed protein product [Commensalibacter communis]CAI3958994.1 unnamed protein product [Commensalibacter communis]CAI3959207.1 unnamed protein product [Commensalibacter communis]CAI3960149.1 unnamed protein product [Commensalibacter communis]